MIINIFSIPIFIGNINASKIKFVKSLKTKPTWLSKTPSSYNIEKPENVLEEKSIKYILETFANELTQYVTGTFNLSIRNIWKNNYTKNDYQEPHIHAGSDLSFIIYKDVEESKTVFLNPAKNIIECFKNMCSDTVSIFSKETFRPTLRSNQFVMFPSYLEHMVIKSNKPQSTIAGNLRMIKDENRK